MSFDQLAVPSRFILFDLDGTLIDGVDDLVIAINTVLSPQHLAPLSREELQPMLGDGIRMLTRRAFTARQVMLTDAEHEHACAVFLAAYESTGYRHTRLYPGVANTLQHLRDSGWRVGLASNKPTRPCNEILTRLGIRELFDAVVGGDALLVKKPDGEHLRHTLAQMAYCPSLTGLRVMVGDHANDVNAARDAGIAAIAVALEVDDAYARSLGADALVTEFRELPAALTMLAPD